MTDAAIRLSTTEITRVSCVPIRCRCPSNVRVESIDCQARLSGGTRLPYVGRVELYPTFGGFEPLPAGVIPSRDAKRTSSPAICLLRRPATIRASTSLERRPVRYFIVELAESHLTQRLFGQLLGSIERLA